MNNRACSYKIGRPGDLFRTICTYCVAFTLCSIATEGIKQYVGYLRPVYFDLCEPDDQYETCTGDEDWIHEISKSFVSGHASFAFCGCALFSMFLERTIGITSVHVAVLAKPAFEGYPDESQQSASGNACIALGYRKPPGLRRVGSIVSVLPWALAIWIAASRVVDNLHFPADIVGGSVLGAATAIYCHNLWFPDTRFLP